MRQPTLTYIGFFISVPLLLAHCSTSSNAPSNDAGSSSGGSSGQSTGGSSTSGTAGKPGTGGSVTGGTGGSVTGGTGATGSAGRATGGAGGTTGGTGGSTGGTTPKGGSGGSTGGSGGSNAGRGGSTAGTGGSTGGSGGSTGGSGGSAGMATGGSAGMAGSAGAATTCAAMDQNGKANWTPGAMTSTTRDYLRSCDIRLINNNWGAQALNCPSGTSSYSVFVNTDGSFGWNFNRGNCDTQNSNQDPDFPEIEFGVHPFGAGSSLATTPDFSSTTVLPIQIKDITSASVTINNMNIQLQQSGSWDLTFEFWVSQQNPLGSSPGVYAELMTFWGWQALRWPECSAMTSSGCPGPTGSGAGDQVTAGNKTYKLEVQSDTWANSQWRYFQFRSTDGPSMNFSGKVDVKPLIDYLVQKRGYSTDFWISRFEVGSEIDDLTQGKVTLDSITFEVNGQTRSAGKM